MGWRQPMAKEKGHRIPSEIFSGDRAIRRARARVRDIALCTDFKYFVTLTLDSTKIDRYDFKTIVKRLNIWLDNNVRRKGLAYVLVPERHKDGAIHFHGFFNDALPAVDSGTVSMPGRKAPVRARSARHREQMLSQGGQVVYNLPGWGFGFSTAIEIYGDYAAAVSYVCKYIGKDMDTKVQATGGAPAEGGRATAKIGGRWYYSGGALGHPEITYTDLFLSDALSMPGAYAFTVKAAYLCFVMYDVKEAVADDVRRRVRFDDEIYGHAPPVSREHVLRVG
jgi:hypothetical protein